MQEAHTPWTEQQPDSKGTVEDVLRPGSEMVAAGYTMYGSSANLVLSTGQGVNGYTLDPSLGEFILTHPDVSAVKTILLLSLKKLATDHHPIPRQDLLLQ